LEELRDLGNTLIVIEHDPETIRRADWIVDFGPNAGRHGGKIIASGVLETILANQESLTGQYLSGTRATEKKRRQGNGHMLNIFGAAQNNLKNVNVSFPLGKLICVTGVSGSGKSSLVNDFLYSKLAFELNRSNIPAGKHEKMEGVEFLDKVIGIDQSPIGRTPRSNPATYTGFFSDIRDLFSKTTDAQERGYGPGRFSFNVKGGRCESCKGDGMVQIEMQFLPTVYVPCATCHGARYNRETLEVRLKGKNIAEVLNMTCDEANEFFANYPALSRKLKTICDVGLGYIQLGQSSTTLSGGEAQRVKLATQLLRPSTGSTLYVLDEPTTGLHMADINLLLIILNALVDAGNTVVIIEHNMDVIEAADYIIDLGPEGGDLGGEIVCVGTPEQVAACPESYTGQFLRQAGN
jgi:excinuclease ABC subunit A